MTRFGFKNVFRAVTDFWHKESTDLHQPLTLGGFFTFEAFNEDGTRAWVENIVLNGVNNAALNDILSVYFNSGTQKTTWYLGLVDNAGFSAFAAGDTASSHAGWSESSAYSESVRQTWTPGSPSGQSITNPTSATFSINATVTIKGAFLISNNTKGGTTGTLWATGAFSSNQSLVNGQSLKVTYTCTAASS